MKRLTEQFNRFKDVVTTHPMVFTFATVIGLSFFLLRKYHYKFIVYPQVGGRSNNENVRGYRHPSQSKLQSQDIEIETERNLVLRGWYVKKPSATQIMVYFHENAGNIGGRLFFIKEFLKSSDTNILIVAYRGFSDSDGKSKPNEAEIMKDAAKIFEKGVELGRRDKLPVFVLGRSLGGAAAIHVLSLPEFKYAAKGLVLQNTFTSIYDVAANMVPAILSPLKGLLWLITKNSYKSISKIQGIHVPILFVKGRKDQLVPARLMDQLQKKCEENKREHFTLQVQDGTHNDTWYVNIGPYFCTLNEFMNHCSRI